MMGEALLSACIQVLVDRLATREVVDFIRGKKLYDGLIKKLRITLLSLKLVLADAEARQLRDQAVKAWLDEIKEVIYDAEDLMVEIKSDAMQRKLDVEARDINANQVTKFISTSLIVYDKVMKTKLEGILERLEFVVKQKDVLGLGEGSSRPYYRRPRSTPLVDESSIYGRNNDKEAIVKLLLSDDGGHNKISVIPIVGLGGIGKTALAQLVYDDNRVTLNFGPKVWVTVSDEDEPDVFRIMKKIFEAITFKSSTIEDLYQLQVQMKAVLGRSKFLLVLDDVWDENYINWDVLKSPFAFCANGSKIIVTTRSENVASIMGNSWIFRVQMISEEDSWELFARHAFDNGDWQAHPALEAIGRQIVRKCNGHPLAVKSLSGLLQSKLNIEEWEKMLKRDIWELFIKEHNVFPSLWLSYHHLPSHLKRCFAYCSIFPKGYEMRKEQLILLWMAEDLLEDEKGKAIEDVGDEYFQDLVSRSLFHQSTRGLKSTVTMHDLVHDLAIFISGEFCSRLDNGDSDALVSKTRHVSFMNENVDAYQGIMKFEKYVASKENCLRTFLSLTHTKAPDHLFPNKWILPAIPGIRCLRVLSLIGYHIDELPDSISNLKHLRYLDLSQAKIKELPETIGFLYNLQALLLNSCLSLSKLPDSIGNLKQLRHLDLSFSGVEILPESICELSNLQSLLLSSCDCLAVLPSTLGRLTNLRHLSITETPIAKMPSNIGHMTALHNLSDFILTEHTGANISELKELRNLRGGLRISGLDDVRVDTNDVQAANLNDKKYLSQLKLVWRDNTAGSSEKEREILNMLRPHTNLKELLIQSYSGLNFPDWIGHNLYSNMVKLSLIECTQCISLPSLGELPYLTNLKVSGLERIVSIGIEFYSTTTPFRSLEILHFEDMSSWQEWSLVQGDEDDGRIFPRLKELNLINCSALFQAQRVERERSGTLFESLQRVKLEKCPQLELFPGGGFPQSLIELDISGCNRLLQRRFRWDLQRLGSLRSFRIEDTRDVALHSFPDEGLLPISLTHLVMVDLPRLQLLNGNAIIQLINLQQLKICDCPALESLPDEGWPVSLRKLTMQNCPTVEQRCQVETGVDWPKISHIPVVEF